MEKSTAFQDQISDYKRNNFKMKSSKKVLIFLVLGFLFISLTLGAYCISLFRMKPIDVTKGMGTSLSYYIDSCHFGRSLLMHNGYWEISGWACDKSQDINTIKIYIILHEKGSSNYYQIRNTQSVKRKSVTEYFNNKHNYDQSGFYAVIDNRNLKKGQVYYIGILADINNKLHYVDTGKIIEKGNI